MFIGDGASNDRRVVIDDIFGAAISVAISWETLERRPALSASADKDQKANRAVAGKPQLQCRCNIRHVAKFTAASRGSLCNSTVFLFKVLTVAITGN